MGDWKTRRTLLERIKDRHDDVSWEDFVHYYRPFINGVLRRMEASPDDADEIAQRVILKAWETLPDFQYDPGKGRFRGWLCRVTGNQARDYFRSKARERLVSTDDVENGEAIAAEQYALPKMEKLAEAEWKSYVSNLAWRNIEPKLNDRCARAFLMRVDGASTDDIAAKLGVAEKSVYVYAKRARDALRAEIMRLNRELL